MGRRRLIKTTVADASRDLISSLPVEVKHRILECLPTQDAARTALLSTHWNDVWLQHGRLAFDCNFSYRVKQGYFKDKGRTLAGIIDNILLSRAGPAKKFTLDIGNDYRQSDFNRWCLFLSKNGVEELHITFYNGGEAGFKLPFCILSCRTIKQLRVEFPIIDLPVNNVGGIFSNVTSLFFSDVEFRRTVNGTASSISISIPNLENLYVDASLFATAINLQVLGLYELRFGSAKQLTAAMQLLQKCPNLCELGITAYQVDKFHEEAASRLLEDPDGCFIVQDLKMLNTIKIESFRGFTVEILFVKMLLSKSPALEKVVIMESCFIDTSVAIKSLRELRFPRASPNAQIVCMEHKGAMSGWAMGEL
ncbi:F-box/FBD/LRR-repeat protein At1g13570-like [Ipomoea triloba]|uniref:F-box/FBD/LRR-repeat protein At1g13570-like n=1 Tax=Ipomoea triloba TaxID=35885 RepID=UPI00125D5FC0|nr:F-box/FBD/LRR-repeat protein At1g13570-like [Ipomoea triloba]